MLVRSALTAILALGFSLAGPAPAAAIDYDSGVERFAIDGNVHGAPDGVDDFVDEFDDGAVGAPWATIGSATEGGGAVRLHNPGVSVFIPGLTPAMYEQSTLQGDLLTAGAGDAVVRVTLVPEALAGNDGIHVNVSSYDSNAFYYSGFVLSNYNSALAALFNPPFPVGLTATAHRAKIEGQGGQSLSREHQAIPTGSVTGAMVIELRYDDSAHELTPALSVDGGATFAHVFAPVPIAFGWDPQLRVYVGAVGYSGGECPAPLLIRSATFGKMGSPSGDEKVKLHLTASASSIIFGATDPLRIVIEDEGAGGATLLDFTAPDGATAFQQSCGPQDGWGRKGYKNVSGALPPACVPGSANGVQRVGLRWNGALDLKLVAKGSAVPSIVGPIRVSIYDGAGPVNECDGWTGTAPCTVRSRSTRCGS